MSCFDLEKRSGSHFVSDNFGYENWATIICTSNPGWPDLANFRLLSDLSLWKITEIAQISGLLFSTVKVIYKFHQNMRLGYILGVLFTSSSGHSARIPHWHDGMSTRLKDYRFDLGFLTDCRWFLNIFDKLCHICIQTTTKGHGIAKNVHICIPMT
jgi:hypothetical protein